VTDAASSDLWYGTPQEVPHSDTEMDSEQPRHKLRTTPSTGSLQMGSQPIKGSFHLRQHLVRDPEYANVFIVSSSEVSCQKR